MHAISLKEHWTATELEPGRVRFSRRFGAPRNADAETIWLVGTAIGDGRMFLNGEMVAAFVAGRFEAEITLRLKPRNEVILELAEPPTDVAVEIR